MGNLTVSLRIVNSELEHEIQLNLRDEILLLYPDYDPLIFDVATIELYWDNQFKEIYMMIDGKQKFIADELGNLDLKVIARYLVLKFEQLAKKRMNKTPSVPRGEEPYGPGQASTLPSGNRWTGD